MTNKTPQSNAENPVNTPATLARTKGTVRYYEPKNRALPQADALKMRFKAGSIPLQSDFADLIDLANMGRLAVGSAEGQTGPADGFILSSEGRLELKPNAAKGISADQDGIAVKIGNGVAVNSSGVNVKLAKGSNTNGGGGQGTDGFTAIGCAGGLELSAKGLSIDAGSGIQIDSKGVSIKLAANSGLSADETYGLNVVPEQQFQKGMIMMFSGTKVPSGWALCDGSNGTPDLRNRFIRASSGLSSSKGGSNTTSFTPRGTVSINNHVLTINQIPSHTHKLGYYYDGKYSAGYRYPVLEITGSPKKYEGAGTTASVINKSGGGEGHNHGASFLGSAATINIEPEYISLAFIMKL